MVENTVVGSPLNDAAPFRCYHPKLCSFCGGDDDEMERKMEMIHHRVLLDDPVKGKKEEKCH